MRWGILLVWAVAACSGQPVPAASDASAPSDAVAPDAAAADAMGFPATLDGNRDRLLHTYWVRLQSIPDTAQANGLVGNALPDVCALWQGLTLSARDVFLTITHRLDGATLDDGSAALDHVVRLYRVDGGGGATSTDPGTCGGGEENRMFLSMDAALQAAFVSVNSGGGGLADIAPHGDWRASQDLAGPHTPFDQSDETNDGAPRGQTQYFAAPTSALAKSPLGRQDVENLIDPYALEIDQDYDCTHNSNPLCSYVFYGPGCAPETSALGTEIYAADYGDFEPGWKPSGC